MNEFYGFFKKIYKFYLGYNKFYFYSLLNIQKYKNIILPFLFSKHTHKIIGLLKTSKISPSSL